MEMTVAELNSKFVFGDEYEIVKILEDFDTEWECLLKDRETGKTFAETVYVEEYGDEKSYVCNW